MNIALLVEFAFFSGANENTALEMFGSEYGLSPFWAFSGGFSNSDVVAKVNDWIVRARRRAHR